MKNHSFVLLATLISVGCQPSTTETVKSVTSVKPEPMSVQLTAGAPDSLFAPRYSPPGKGLELKPIEIPASQGFDGLETEVVLGSPVEKQKPIKMLIARAAAGEAYTKLTIDLNGDGKYDEEAIVIKTTESRGNIWSSFSTTLKVNYIDDKTITEDYPVNLWIAVASLDEQPKVLRISRRGFKSGELQVGDQKVTVILSDSNNDAIFGEGDWWELRSKDGPAKSSEMRKVGEYSWLGESAYKLEVNDVRGSSVKLASFDPGITREEDALARDPYGADKKAVKADKPLEFRHDIDAAIAEAVDKKQRCFIKFETTWCGPCQMMTQNVFTAKDVVDASKDVVCVKVDGDQRRDLVERYAVTAYPTGLMIAADGTEAARFVGYQKVTAMTDFLKEKKAEPAK